MAGRALMLTAGDSPHVSRSLSYRSQSRGTGVTRAAAALLAPLVVLSLVACARIGNPEGWSGGAVVGETLYIGTSEGELLALERATGQTLWRFELRGEERERAIYGTPAVTADTVYVGGYDSVLYALDLDGELKWQEPLGGSIVGGPVVVDDLVLVGSSDGNMYAFDTLGEFEKWRFASGGSVWSTPAVAEGLVYFGSMDHNVYAVSLEDGREVWRFPTRGAISAAPEVAKGRVLVGSFDGVFYAVDAATGEEAWRFEGASNWFWGRAIVAGDTVYAPSLDGNLYALDISTGRLRWTLETDGPIIGSPAIMGDMIAVPSVDGKVRLAGLRDGSVLGACNIDEKIRTRLVAQLEPQDPRSEGFIYFGVPDGSIRALRIKQNGNPDQEWVHPPTDRAPPC